MKRVVLLGFAVLFAVAAIILAILGLRSGSGKSPGDNSQGANPAQLDYSVVVAASDLPAGRVLQPGDIVEQKATSLPVNTFSALHSVIGRRLLTPATAGQPVTRDMLVQSHPLADQLKVGERAVALQTTTIVGVGGHLRPGDHVDLLVYLRGQSETLGRSSAQFVLNNLRVLAYENRLPGDEAEEPLKKTSANDDAVARLNRVQTRPEKNHSVVLAVPADDVPRLLLASESGSVRLALRPPETANMLPAGLTAYESPPANAHQAQQVTLAALSYSNPVVLAAPPVKRKTNVVTKVEVFEGEKSRTVTFNK